VPIRPAAEWVFHPRPPRGRSERAELAADPRELGLRAGHALGAEFELLWETGPRAAVVIRPADAASDRWTARTFATGFEVGQWRSRRAIVEGPAAARVRFCRVEGGVLAGVARDRPAWSDVVVRVLPGLPAGLRARWRFRPAGLPTSTPTHMPGLEPQFQPLGFRLRNPPWPERATRDLEALADHSPRWAVSLVIEAAPPTQDASAIERWATLLRTAGYRTGRGALVFRRPIPLVGSAPPTFLLSEPELLAILPSADTYFAAGFGESPPGIERIRFGTDSAGGPAAVETDPRQGRHLVALGETGMGKSSLLVRLARGAAGRGSVILLDPIGDTGRALLGALPSRFARDVVWISPQSSPIAVDLLAAVRRAAHSPSAADRAVGDLVSALRRVRAGRYPEAAYWGPRIEETVRATLRVGALLPEATMADLPALLSSAHRRPVGIPEPARSAFEELATRARERPDEVDGSRRLLAELTERPALAALLGDPAARFTIEEMFAPGRITVLTGDAGTIGEDAARYLLAVHLALLWSARLVGPVTSKAFLLLDEAQWYAHDSVSEMLRLGRRANLHVWMATQSLDALPENVREAIHTNVADFLLFRGSPVDARDLGRMTSRLDLEAVWSQPPGHAIALLGKGEHVVPVRVDPPLPASGRRMEDRLALAIDSSSRFLPSPPSGTDPRQSSPSPTPMECTEPMVLAIWSELLDRSGPSTSRFYLEELRRTFDPSGERVREVGRQLKAAGALVRSDRDELGSFWEVARPGFDRLLARGVDPGALDSAARRWRERDSTRDPALTR
jgi:hypothetical protein